MVVYMSFLLFEAETAAGIFLQFPLSLILLFLSSANIVSLCGSDQILRLTYGLAY